MILTQYIGDNKVHKIPLRWMRQEFDPTGYELLFTVKSAVTDADAYAKIQKELGIGLTVLGSVASVAFLHVDTAGDAENDPVIPALASGEYVWDIQATLTEESVVTDVKTVASGTLTLTQDVTRELGSTTPIYTHNPSSPDWISSALAGVASKTTPVDADTIPLTDSEDSSSLKKLSWSNLKATAKSYFDTLYAAALGIDDNYVTDAEKVVIGNTSGTNTGDQDLSGFATQSALAAETAAREARDGGVPSNARFVMDGDSITNPNLAVYPTQTSWVPFFEDLPNCTGRGTVSNVAVSGSTYSSMIARYAANVYPLRPTSGEPVYLFTMIGSNDGGTASSTWISALEAYWTTAKADGFTIVAITPPVHDANSNTLRFASSVRTSTVPDYVVNLGEVFRSSNNAEMFLVDDLHPTEKGAKLIAQAVNNALFGTTNNATNRPLTVGSTGLGVGTDDPRAATHLIGVAQLRLGNNQSPNTIKSFALALEPYGASSDTVFDFMGGASSSTYNNVYIGRGASANKAATQAQFWATTNATATASSAVMYGILASGKWTFGNLASSNNAAGLAIAINDSGNPGFSISRTAGANSRQSGVFGLPAANGSLVLNSLQDELVIAPQTGKSLAFATAVLPSTNYQTVRIRIKASGVVNFVTSPTTYADNAAAISGGLTTGDVYKTSTGQLMIVY
jgi:lysophospholipase L1-like esterase